MREALVSWNHAQIYDCPTYDDYANRLGNGQFEKVYDLGARARTRSGVSTHAACTCHVLPRNTQQPHIVSVRKRTRNCFMPLLCL